MGGARGCCGLADALDGSGADAGAVTRGTPDQAGTGNATAEARIAPPAPDENGMQHGQFGPEWSDGA